MAAYSVPPSAMETTMPESEAAFVQPLVDLRFEDKPVRIVMQGDDPWWVLADVCKVLEIANPRDAAGRLDDDERGVAITDTLGGPQQTTIINESGLYSLILTSRKAEAKRFKKWVTAEVLPAIRKTGGYMVAAPDETPEALALRALTVLHATVERQKAELAIAQPKAEALDRIASADGSLSVTEAAKALQMRPKDLFAFLNQNGWIYRRAGSGTWLGYQSRTNGGDLHHVVTTVLQADGTERVCEQVKVTPRGLAKLAKLTPNRMAAA